MQDASACGLTPAWTATFQVGVLLGPRAAAGTVHALLLRTAALLGHRLRDTVDLPALLAAAPEAAQSRLAAAAGACDAWRRGYLATRAELEAGGQTGRWEHDRAALFAAAGKSLAAGAQDLLDTSLTRCPGAADGARLLGKLLRDRHAGVALLRHVPEKVTDLVQTFAAEIRVAEREADRWCEGGAGNRTPYPGLSALTSTLLRVSVTRSRLEEAATAIQASGEALTPEDQGVMAACAALVQRLALAEVDIWRDWVERAEREVGTAMRQPLLVQPPQEAASGWALARIKLPELSDHVQAAQQARCLGIAVPPFLRGAALALPLMLEAGRRLQALLQQLAESRRKLRSPERLLLQPALEKVRLALLPGTQHMHWGSLSLDAFISSVQKAIAAFTCTAKAVACAASEMRRALRALPRETNWPGEGTDTGSRVVDHAATNAGLGGSVRRGEEAAVAAAHSLQATLVRIEEGVLGTSTGSARSMAAYYEHWERRLQDALADCAISWIEGLTSRLSGSCDDTGRTIHVQVWDDEDVGCERVTHHEDLMHDPGIFAATASFSVLLQGMERTAEQ
ncbi:Dynein-1-alpha heavy chain, flagellar inner arm I1 complex [Auxenochlorella protothecoides]|uniref:Dynein-1-alpha heavy chain, flagellar inner arm I1 complex n=1 Tax=Auxenochlorella protothecoides TaxID=3075 RepID=A0A087STT8_AUXPR|nr:Dynein-1-alpha heavy chain, flagellar inner arm I1 complex [Auxenochlorella protothecoides]KFM29142.1 Dynein-1-alpha heavy chain, flagellar inner arm I1 complex [Auxenochlorella protothecoides]